MSRGWIKIPREIMDENWYFTTPFSYKEALLDLLLLANHQDRIFAVRGIEIEVPRGCVAKSQITLGERWGWSRGKVRRFLQKMEQQNYLKVIQQKSHITTVIKVADWLRGYKNDTTDDATNGTTGEAQKKNVRNINTSKEKKNIKEKKVKHKYGEYGNVLLTNQQIYKLIDKFGFEKAENWIQTLSEGKKMKGYKYKDDYLAILNWERRDRKKQESEKKEKLGVSHDDFGG